MGKIDKEKDPHTILVEKYKNAASVTNSINGYKGLRIHALDGLHEFAAAQAGIHCKNGSQFLDLAAGTGAMSLRLVDMGFAVTATDYVTENFRLHNIIPFFQANLNDDFSAGREQQFDGIMASEIIEHLENPRHFARQCFKLLRFGGKIILSTPNVDCVASIASFIRHGTFQWFSDLDYKEEGHITPITQWQIEKSFSEAGFRFLWRNSFGDKFGKLAGSPRLMMFSWILTVLVRRHPELKNQIFVAVLEKPFE